jgi:hypothetical protein
MLYKGYAYDKAQEKAIADYNAKKAQEQTTNAVNVNGTNGATIEVSKGGEYDKMLNN